ncbi:hypothetical protein ABT010_41480 [Streptomyces sp. NPDC002668]|uniref:hypothetical protein n=1 Tax=Streptomyces sp. NPDC002668 TaxID=3154422 RepID=UPI003316EC5A
MGWDTVILVFLAVVVPGAGKLLRAVASRQRALGRAELIRAKAELKKTLPDARSTADNRRRRGA